MAGRRYAPDPQHRNALLRREGIYTSTISEWRRARDAAARGAISEKKPGRPARDAAEAEMERLRRENEKLAADLARTKAALEVVGKAHAQRATHPAALLEEEREKVLAILDSDRFVDKSPAQAWAVLLDDGRYLCSIRSMYRILEDRNEVRERRAQASHPPRVRPELVAEGPDKVWTWDITKLKTPWKGGYFDLYVMLDIFSRKVIHWEVHSTETGELAKEFMENAIMANGGARPDYIHADNGVSMTSQPVGDLLSSLRITRSHSRPHNEHRHSGIGLHTPASVHDGTARKIREHRQEILDAAYAAHPERFRSRPVAPKLPERAWINKPRPTIVTQQVTRINQAA